MACPLCEEISTVERREQPWAIAKLTTGYLWLNPTQYHRGAAFFVANTCVAELHDLEPAFRQGHLMEMSAVAAAVHRASGARKMNYEALGNGVRHLHWWLTPRQANDPRPRGPIWEDLDFLRLLWTSSARPEIDEASAIRADILRELRKENITIEDEYL